MSNEPEFKVGDKVRRVSGGGPVGHEFVIGRIGSSPERITQPCAWPQGAYAYSFHYLKHLELVFPPTLEDELKDLESKVAEVKAKIAERDAPKVGEIWHMKGYNAEMELLHVGKTNQGAEYVVACNKSAVGAYPFAQSLATWKQDYVKVE